MALKIEVKLKGKKEYAKSIPAIEAAINSAVMEAANMLQTDFIEEQRRAGHWVTGNMGRSYYVKKGDMKAQVGNSVDYMPYVRFGHHSYKGDDFITRVVNTDTKKVTDLINKKYRAVLK